MNREYKRWFATLKKTAKKDEGKAVTEIVVNKMLWNCVNDLIALRETIIELLRLVVVFCHALERCTGRYIRSIHSAMEDTKKLQISSSSRNAGKCCKQICIQPVLF